MCQRYAGGVVMVEHNIGHAWQILMSRDSHRRQQERLAQLQIYGDEAFYTALQQQLGISIQQFGIVPVDYRKKKIILLPQILFNTADDQGTVGIADLLGDYSNHISSLAAQRTGKKVRPVIQFFGSSVNAILGFLRNGTGGGRIVQYRRYRAWRQPNVLGNHL